MLRTFPAAADAAVEIPGAADKDVDWRTGSCRFCGSIGVGTLSPALFFFSEPEFATVVVSPQMKKVAMPDLRA